MPVKIARSAPSTIVRAARAAGSHPHLASVLLQGRKSANIRASSGGIRGIPRKKWIKHNSNVNAECLVNSGASQQAKSLAS